MAEVEVEVEVAEDAAVLQELVTRPAHRALPAAAAAEVPPD